MYEDDDMYDEGPDPIEITAEEKATDIVGLPNLTLSFQYEPGEMMARITEKAAISVAERITRSLESEIQQKVTALIDVKVNEIVEGIFVKKFQPVDQFGDRVGIETTIKDLIATKAERFLDEKVDDDGRAGQGYQYKTVRSEYLVSKLLKNTMDYQTKKAIEKLTVEAKAGIDQKVAELIASVITKA